MNPSTSQPEKQRDDRWLQGMLDETWDRYFADVPQANDVRIIFGRRARRRLGQYFSRQTQLHGDGDYYKWPISPAGGAGVGGFGHYGS